MTFSYISKSLRKEKGLSQVELAKALNISKACISMIEIGKNEPTANTLIRYADFFEVSIDYLLGREDDFGNITIYSKTETIDHLSPDEQQIVNTLRNSSPFSCLDWVKLYADLPRHLQENIFHELKGMSLASKKIKKIK